MLKNYCLETKLNQTFQQYSNESSMIKNYQMITLNYPSTLSYSINNYMNNSIERMNIHSLLNANSPYNRQFYDPKSFYFLNNKYSDIFKIYPISNKSEKLINSSNHNELISASSSNTSNEDNKKKIFKVIYPEKPDENTYIKYIDNFNEKNFKKRERHSIRRRRCENQDNIRKKIKRVFLNNFLYNKLNALLKKGGSILFFEKFPQNFVADVNKKTNKTIIDMTLKTIIEKKENYIGDILERNYNHNMRVLDSLKEKKNEELEKVINMKYRDLFKEFLNSNEFKIDEINRLKKKKMKDSYIMRYIYLSKLFIKFFEE
jgi:hypothetical protein